MNASNNCRTRPMHRTLHARHIYFSSGHVRVSRPGYSQNQLHEWSIEVPSIVKGVDLVVL